MKYICNAICDTGRVRRNNEDNCYLNGAYRENTDLSHYEHSIDIDDQIVLAAVFDGMGGEADGEIASLEAAKRLVSYQDRQFEDISGEFVSEANSAICDLMDIVNGERMGSTLAIVRIEEESFSLCNVGDSPIYMFRDGTLEQMSVDHNAAQNMYELGLITKEEVKTDKHKHCLTQHLGIYEDELIIEPYVLEDKMLVNEDIIMLCSDGLTDMVQDKEIEEILGQNMSVNELAHELIDRALDKGGRDNVTVILIKAQE